ncbi:MAG: RluA family pseudouridine synthase, partial [Stutzerimonas stutzeri]
MGGKGTGGPPRGNGPKRGGRPPASGAPKGKRPSHDARRSARARPRPAEDEVVRTAPTRNPKPHHPAPRAAAPRKPAPRKPPITDAPTRAEVKAVTAEVLATGVQQLVVTPDENEMRIDRFLEARFP